MPVLWCVLVFVTDICVVKMNFLEFLNDILAKCCLKLACLKYNMNVLFGNLHERLYCSGTLY